MQLLFDNVEWTPNFETTSNPRKTIERGNWINEASRKFSKEFKQTAIRRLQSGQSTAEVARAVEVQSSELCRWRRELDEHQGRAFQGVGRRRAEESRVAELERNVGQQALEIDFLKRAWQHVEEQRRPRALHPGCALCEHIEKDVTTRGRLTVREMCGLAGVSRASYYRFPDCQKPCAADLDLRDQIQRIALEWPATAAGGSRPSCADEVGMSTASASNGCCAKTIYSAW